MSDRTKPSAETREAEAQEAGRKPKADRPPTPEEEELAEKTRLDDDVAAREKDMAERGARQKGEGRIP